MEDGSQWPRISIVTPSYNQARFIEETIRSVLLQGYPDLEYIIIDGGSSDGSVDVIAKYESWLSYWVSEPDRGQAAAINKGFELATGEIIAWLNSDDTYTKQALAAVGLFFTRHPGADVLCGGGIYVFEDGVIARKYKSSSADLERMVVRNNIIQPSTFFRKNVWQNVDRLDESLRFSFDLDLWLKSKRRYSFATHHQYFSKFRLHEQGKTLSHRLLMAEESAKTTIKFVTEQFESSEQREMLYRFMCLKLAVLSWLKDGEDLKSIKHYLDGARVASDLFEDGWLLQNLMLTFVGPIEALRPEARVMREHRKNMEDFYRTHLSSLLPQTGSAHLSSLFWHFYSTIAFAKKKPFFLLLGLRSNPWYALRLVWRKTCVSFRWPKWVLALAMLADPE
jgi:glycosyltransferase involved in cell wall biosynthesis